MSDSNGWRTTDLQDLVEIDPEVLRENTDRDYHFHYVDIASVSEGRIDVPSVTIAFRSSPSRARKIVRRGDVLMSTVRPNLRAFAYFDQPFNDCVVSTGFAVLRAKPKVDPRFVLYSILSESVTRQIDAHVVGSNYPAINSTAVRQLKVLTPSPVEQAKIAEVLSAVDRAIEQTEALIAKQQRIKTGLMQDLLTRGIDEHGNLRSEQTHEFKDSPLGRIPVGWEVRTISQLCDLGRGRVISAREIESCPGTFPVYSSQSMKSGEMGRIVTFDFEGEFVTWTTDGAYAGTVFHRTGRFNCTNVCGTLRSKCAVSMRFLAYQLSTVAKANVSYVGNPKLMNGVMGRIQIALPIDNLEQKKISQTIECADENLERYALALGKLRSIKRGLMQDLLTGKRRVTALLEQREGATP